MLIVDLDKKKCMQDIQITDERDSFRMPEKIVNILKNDLINLTRISKFKSESEKNVDLCLVCFYFTFSFIFLNYCSSPFKYLLSIPVLLRLGQNTKYFNKPFTNI
jgi:hypothetical protein